jgi:hypothetical protein
MPSYDRALWALRTWLDSWAGVGHIAVGMHRRGYATQSTSAKTRVFDIGNCGPPQPPNTFWRTSPVSSRAFRAFTISRTLPGPSVGQARALGKYR